ncbi:MAG: ECF transporter S component [Ruminococcus sp.]|nr:ECF transporter S component [Ruminococcus sp.]
MQYVDTKSTHNTNARILVLTALFAALTTVLTMTIKIPTITGYVHPGDSMIYLGASILPGPYGIIAGAIGGGLADLLSGYPHWIIPSAIIKGLNAVPFILAFYIQKKRGKSNRIINPLSLTALVPSSIITILGYFIAHLFMKDWAYAVAAIPNELFQVLAAAIIFTALGFGLDGMKFKDRVLK